MVKRVVCLVQGARFASWMRGMRRRTTRKEPIVDMRLAIKRHIESLEMSLQHHDEVLNSPRRTGADELKARISSQRLIEREIEFDQRCREELPLRPAGANKEPNSTGEPNLGDPQEG